ncbi:MAG: GPW/gp25 family protein [Bacteroidota bacterium]
MASENKILGTGWSFPPEFVKEGRNVENSVSGVHEINESLEILLSTTVGERIMQHSYGCDLTQLLFEPLNVTLVSFVSDLIQNAILLYEPRILLEDVDITANQEEGRLDIRLDYTVRAVNTRFNYVFPYYLNEASALI